MPVHEVRRTDAKAFFGMYCDICITSLLLRVCCDNLLLAPCDITTQNPITANERTFMHWMNMSVTIGSISAALLGVSGHAHKHWGSDYVKQAVAVRVLALTMMLIGICMAIYAAVNFRIRGNMLLYVYRVC